jgi:hypothetical protein
MKKKQRTSKPRALPAAELDAMHDAGVDLSAHVDLSQAFRPGRTVQGVHVDLPLELLREIDQEARRLGVTRQAFIFSNPELEPTQLHQDGRPEEGRS